MNDLENNRAEKRLKRLAWFLDSSIRLPGGFRIGAESIVGLVPGIGDALGAMVSSYIVFEAAKLGVSKTTLLKMTKNVLLETIVGVIPIVGDIFDMAYKANLRNAQLIEDDIARDDVQARSNKKIIFYISTTFIVLLSLLIWLAIKVFGFIINLVS